MLRMSKDHRSAGLWWSLLLSGGSLGGHGRLLSPFSSCLITFCFSWCCRGSFRDGVHRDQWTKGRTSFLFMVSCFSRCWPGQPWQTSWSFRLLSHLLHHLLLQLAPSQIISWRSPPRPVDKGKDQPSFHDFLSHLELRWTVLWQCLLWPLGNEEFQPWRTVLVSWGRQWTVLHLIDMLLALSSPSVHFSSWCCRRCSSGGIYGGLLDNEKNQTSPAIMVLWDLYFEWCHLLWRPWQPSSTFSAPFLSSPWFLVTPGFAVDGLEMVSTVTSGQWWGPSFFCNDEALRSAAYLGNEFFFIVLSSVMKRGGKMELSRGSFPSLHFELF